MDPVGFPNGSQCLDDLECQSGYCYSLSGIISACSECSSDEDCDFGCTPPGFGGEPNYARCNDGALGSGCSEDSSCAGALSCEFVLFSPGVFEDLGGCSECEQDADCEGAQLCQPFTIPSASVGYLRCVDPGSLSLGETCALGPEGDNACASTHCAASEKFFTVGVCSQCSNTPAPNTGCDPGETCTDPIAPLVEAEAIEPGLCE
jgi:hypothetical protein